MLCCSDRLNLHAPVLNQCAPSTLVNPSAMIDPSPAGWTDIDALVAPYQFQFYDPVFSRNGQLPTEFKV
jgi:hypothetical protein